MERLSKFSLRNKPDETEEIISKANIFHRLSIEELSIKSNSPNEMPVLIELNLRPKALNFRYITEAFTINDLKCKILLINFSHSSNLEFYLNLEPSETEKTIYSISFELKLNKYHNVSIISVSPSYKQSYFICKIASSFPATILCKGQLERNHTELIKELFYIKAADIEENCAVIDSARFELILNDNQLNVSNEDEALMLLGAWCNNNNTTEDIIKNMLNLIRWSFITLQGLYNSLKYPLLKSSISYKTAFHREFLIKSGIISRSKVDMPRDSCRKMIEKNNILEFLGNLTDCLFQNYTKEKSTVLEQKASKIIENSSKVNKLQRKLNSIQCSLNSSMCQATTAITPLEKINESQDPITHQKQLIDTDYQNHFSFNQSLRVQSVTPYPFTSTKHPPSNLSISLLNKKLKFLSRYH